MHSITLGCGDERSGECGRSLRLTSPLDCWNAVLRRASPQNYLDYLNLKTGELGESLKSRCVSGATHFGLVPLVGSEDAR